MYLCERQWLRVGRKEERKKNPKETKIAVTRGSREEDGVRVEWYARTDRKEQQLLETPCNHFCKEVSQATLLTTEVAPNKRDYPAVHC